jgi:hypothetical protein
MHVTEAVQRVRLSQLVAHLSLQIQAPTAGRQRLGVFAQLRVIPPHVVESAALSVRISGGEEQIVGQLRVAQRDLEPPLPAGQAAEVQVGRGLPVLVVELAEQGQRLAQVDPGALGPIALAVRTRQTYVGVCLPEPIVDPLRRGERGVRAGGPAVPTAAPVEVSRSAPTPAARRGSRIRSPRPGRPPRATRPARR